MNTSWASKWARNVEAMQFNVDGETNNWEALHKWALSQPMPIKEMHLVVTMHRSYSIEITTIDGTIVLVNGEYLVCANGETFKLKSDVFHKIYKESK